MDFSHLLSGFLKARALTHREFAALVAVSPGFISQCASGHSKAPLDRIDSWADALRLSGTDRADFIRSARLDHCPTEIRELVERMMVDQPLTTELLESHRGTQALVDVARQVKAATADYTSDLFLQSAGRAAASDGAHVDGETDRPDPVRIRSRWRVHVIHGTSGGDVVLPGQSVITDPALEPKRNRLVVIPSDNGPVLKRWGEIHDASVVVASISGMDPCLVPLAELGAPEVVVGVLFTDSVAK